VNSDFSTARKAQQGRRKAENSVAPPKKLATQRWLELNNPKSG
jgi:hypothetical protein